MIPILLCKGEHKCSTGVVVLVLLVTAGLVVYNYMQALMPFPTEGLTGLNIFFILYKGSVQYIIKIQTE